VKEYQPVDRMKDDMLFVKWEIFLHVSKYESHNTGGWTRWSVKFESDGITTNFNLINMIDKFRHFVKIFIAFKVTYDLPLENFTLSDCHAAQEVDFK